MGFHWGVTLILAEQWQSRTLKAVDLVEPSRALASFANGKALVTFVPVSPHPKESDVITSHYVLFTVYRTAVGCVNPRTLFPTKKKNI